LPSTTIIPEGQQENRRVEILSSEWEIIKPVIFSLREAVATPPETQFALEVQAGEGVQSWTLAAYAGSQLWREFHGTQSPFVNLRWDWKDSTNNLPRSSLRYQLIVHDSAEVSTVVYSRTIPVRALTIERKEVEHLPEKDVEKINLILFDFGSAVLGWRNEKILQTVREYVTPAASVLVAGFTDMIGEDNFNKTLSEQRAASVRSKLSSIVRTIRPMTTRGFGETSPLFSNSLPEGRFYNRTVQIVVETPVKRE
jgi:outer membrane protein OmpA-like peptidoglycan-associated protein